MSCLVLGTGGDVEALLSFLICHESSCAIAAIIRDGQVAVPIGGATIAPTESKAEDAEDCDADDDAAQCEDALRKMEQCAKSIGDIQRWESGRNAIIAAGRLPLVDVDTELCNDSRT